MSDCPSCNLPKPAEWCWNNNYTCPLGYPPRQVDVRMLLHLVRLLQERVEKLENPPCCGGGPQWGHAWNCSKVPD